MSDVQHHITTDHYTKQNPELSELIAGQIVYRRKPNFNHQTATLGIASFLHHVTQKGRTLLSPFELILGEDNVLQPDVMWVRRNSTKCTIHKNALEGAPDIIVEVLATDTTNQDRGIKFDLYESFGVREYWIADIANQFIEVYRLESGRLSRQGLFNRGDFFNSTPLALNVDINTVFNQI